MRDGSNRAEFKVGGKMFSQFCPGHKAGKTLLDLFQGLQSKGLGSLLVLSRWVCSPLDGDLLHSQGVLEINASLGSISCKFNQEWGGWVLQGMSIGSHQADRGLLVLTLCVSE